MLRASRKTSNFGGGRLNVASSQALEILNSALPFKNSAIKSSTHFVLIANKGSTSLYIDLGLN